MDTLTVNQPLVVSEPTSRNAEVTPYSGADPEIGGNPANSSPGPRRSSRTSKRPNFFHVVHESRLDRETMAAIKRSKLETQQLNIDYATLVEIPTVYATPEEFDNPLTIWNKYSHLGEKFGAIKVVPPKGWHGVCPLDTERLKFKVREQQLQNLSIGKGFSHPSYDWDCHQMKAADVDLMNQLFGRSDPSIEEVEQEYWRIVKNANRSLIVKYGADLNVYSPEFEPYLVDVSGTKCEDDWWNLRNLSKSPGSLLRYSQHTIPGVNIPWLYIGMGLTSFCWHTEDNYFGAVNYHHFGAPKIWYIVPPRKAGRLESLLKDYSAKESAEFAVYSLRIQVAPEILVANGIPVHRIVQRENEFVFAWPRAFHSGLNVGYNCNEACNIAPVNWLPMGYRSLVNYRFYRKTCISFFTLVMSGVCNYRDMNAEDLSHMINALLLLLAQEYETRNSVNYPRVQMYLYLGAEEVFNVNSHFDEAYRQQDFDAADFVRALELLCSERDDDFLQGCTLLSNIPMKDCDLCDTPTFGSCITCAHTNCTVCISCRTYHPCDCSTRVVLYRYPLLAFYRMISILKRAYRSMSGMKWRPEQEYCKITKTALAELDSMSLFSVDQLLKERCDLYTVKARKNLDCNVELCTPIKAPCVSSADMDEISTTDGGSSCDSLDTSTQSNSCEWDVSWFSDLRAAFDRCHQGRHKARLDDEESYYGEIAFTEPCSFGKDTFSTAMNPCALATMTKYTMRYLLLSLEEDCAYLPEIA
ncbi:histone lysine demethylase, putative [Babesia ovis]|uniref:Histone lysine demethylase, putative n=1 Tax=Babesia ovis TaxID=5869 RepID=A0A9W5TCJ5_BABOV|nr:histone lysine demethylase, putative [Babesia ovis]